MEYIETCQTCRGVGGVDLNPSGEPEMVPCGECDGMGRNLTEEGIKLIQFLETVDPRILGRRVPDRGFG